MASTSDRSDPPGPDTRAAGPSGGRGPRDASGMLPKAASGLFGMGAGAGALLVVGKVDVGPLVMGGLALLAVLGAVAVVLPVVVFSRNQWTLSSRGCAFARTVTDVVTLKQQDAAAFGQFYRMVLHRRPVPREADGVLSPALARGERRPSPERDRPGLPAPEPARSGAPPPPVPPHSFWAALTAIERAELTAVAEERTFAAGEVLWREGQPADHVVVVRRGRALVCVERDGIDRVLARRGPGDLLGERAALQVNLRSATVVAQDAVTALKVSTERFAAFLERYPRVVKVVEKQVYDRLTEDTGNRPGHPSRDVADVAEQMAVEILEIVRQQGEGDGTGTAAAIATIRISPAELAGSVEASNEAVTRTLIRWHEAGVVRSYENRLAVIDVGALHRAYGGLGMASRRDVPALAWTGQNCSILLTDIAGFGARIRDHEDRRVVRAAMYELLERSCEASGTSWRSCHREDRGDGALIVVPPSAPTSSVVDMAQKHLAAGLREHNRAAGEARRLQLRAALHVGPVVSDAWGVTGEALIHAARMLDARKLRHRLAETSADLAFITSTFVHDNVIKHGTGGLSPAGYEQVRFQVKESKITAWMRFSGPAAR